jgi:hypothetical protein
VDFWIVVVVRARDLLLLVILEQAALWSSSRRWSRLSTAEWLVIQSLGFWLSRCGQGAACAAGVSIGCRRSSHFSFAGPKEK